jgi:hypothetical protein
MVTIVSLWLPILLSAVAVFVVSSLLHMVLRYHQNDFRRLPQEEAVLEALHKFSIPPGEYALPWCGSMAAMKDPAVQKKMADGPVGFFTVFPNGQPGVPHGSRPAAGRVLCGGSPLRLVHRLPRLFARPGTGVDLVPPPVVDIDQEFDRWIDLRLGDRRDLRLVVAALSKPSRLGCLGA